MKTVIIGGGKGCRAILELATSSFLREFTLDVRCVVDTDSDAPGMLMARRMNIRTIADMTEGLNWPGLELVIELTGRDDVLEYIYKALPQGVRLIDHRFAHIFWDLVNAREEQEQRLREITAMEQKMKQERFFLQSLVDTIPELVVVIDTNKNILRINESMSRFTHVSGQKAIGCNCEQLLGKTSLSGLCDKASHLIDGVLESSLPGSLNWVVPPPEEEHWEVTFVPILDQNLEIEAVVGTWHQITETVRLHREIESAELRFKQFINSAQDWISIKDINGRYIIVNPVCAHALGREPEEFFGNRPEDMLDPETAKMIKAHDREIILGNRYQRFSEVFQIDGRDRHFQTVRFPLSDYSGKTIGVCTISRDVTSERELGDQLVQAGKLAAVGKLAAGVAHEINNPLTGVLAFAEDLLDETDKNDPRYEDIKVIIRETMRCRGIVRNLLDFARQQKLLLKRTDVNEVVRQTLALVHKLPQFRNISFKINLQEEIPAIICDRQQMQQVLLNLMMNAADAMNEMGKIKIATEFDQRHDRCIIAMEDNGPGVPENIKDKIFEPFFSTKGTNGLGLAVSRGIVERHHGIIEVEKARGNGAIFKIVLPARVEEMEP
jgi:PAS domain S-box-containing protein